MQFFTNYHPNDVATKPLAELIEDFATHRQAMGVASAYVADTSENLAWACHRCNRHKGTNLSGIDPDTREVVMLFHPRRDRWSEHFTLVGVRLRGLTATGRATVWLLQMNAERRLERRAELLKRGWY